MRKQIHMLFKYKAIWALILLALLTTRPWPGGGGEASRLAVAQAMVEKHTLAITDVSLSDTIDKAYINGEYYSDKPIMPSVLGAIVYWPLYQMGLKLGPSANLAYYLIVIFTVKLFWLLGIVAFYKALRLREVERRVGYVLASALAVASLYFTFSTVFNNHVLAASQIMIGYYFFIRAARSESIRKFLFISGFFFSLAGVSDVPTAIFYAAFGCYILCLPALRTHIGFYLLPLLLTLAPSAAANYCISGSLVPISLVKEYFFWPGSPWTGEGALSGTRINRGYFLLKYTFHSVLGQKGFILYNPLLFIAIPLIIREVFRKSRIRADAIIITVSCMIMTGYYLLFTNNYSGWSYSIRWFVPLLPLVFYFMPPYFDNYTKTKKAAFISLYALSVIIALIGTLAPWTDTDSEAVPFIQNSRLLLNLLGVTPGF